MEEEICICWTGSGFSMFETLFTKDGSCMQFAEHMNHLRLVTEGKLRV